MAEKHLEDYVLHNDDDMLTFGAWWKLVDDDEVVEVQYPHEHHGLTGKASNHAKKEVMVDFLEFVDLNSQPNGRQAGSYSAQFFFLPKFTRIAAPRDGEEKMQSSVVCQFNKAQTEKGKQTCRNTAATDWLQKHRPKVALHPSMTDYCDTCKHFKEQLSRNQAVLNRLHQSGSATAGEIRALETTKEELEEELADHKRVATQSREYYKTAIDKCHEQWAKIEQLTQKNALTRREREDLDGAKHCFTATISADYQQSKLIPSWGKTKQPGSTYYLQKVSHDIFGIVDHSNDNSVVYLFDERIGPKNTDHTLSFLTHFWNQLHHQHPWIHRLAIFLDNATSTNKNKYLFSWAMEMVSSGEIDHVHISFMVAGYTKFAPDRLFSVTGSAYKREDVFTIHELKALCGQSATTFITDGQQVLTWRDSLGDKYSDLPGVRKLHDFLVVKAHNGDVVMKVRKNCFTGVWKDSPLRVRDSTAIGVPTTTYSDTHLHSISAEKTANMVTMYDRFIPLDRRPDYLPTCSTAPTLAPASTPAPLTTPGRQRKRKQSKCSTTGCDGSGHKNPSRCTDGHKTRAGCPRGQ